MKHFIASICRSSPHYIEVSNATTMFSANENLMLREHKRRVVRWYIEATIPEDALDMGTSVMVMQTVCQTPGCVPLETSVIIVFPNILRVYQKAVEGHSRLKYYYPWVKSQKMMSWMPCLLHSKVWNIMLAFFIKCFISMHASHGHVLIFPSQSSFIPWTPKKRREKNNRTFVHDNERFYVWENWWYSWNRKHTKWKRW